MAIQLRKPPSRGRGRRLERSNGLAARAGGLDWPEARRVVIWEGLYHSSMAWRIFCRDDTTKPR